MQLRDIPMMAMFMTDAGPVAISKTEAEILKRHFDYERGIVPKTHSLHGGQAAIAAKASIILAAINRVAAWKAAH